MTSAPPTVACPHCRGHHPASWTHCPTSGGDLHAGPALVGRVIADRYRVLGLVGEGGMGAVYEAEHLGSGRKVALKRLHPEVVERSYAMERFQREVRAASATDHANVVKVLDVGFGNDGAPYLVMELLEGETLSMRLLRDNVLEAGEAVEIACQALEALCALHAQGIVHRDLKPGNIFLTSRGIKLLDFGISKFQGEPAASVDTLTRTGVTMGTPLYMSPEQARGARNIDHRVDLYALGVILYEVLAGHRPHQSENYHALLSEIIAGDVTRLTTAAPNVPGGLSEVVHRALESDPRIRYQDASQMLDALTLFRSGSRISVTPSIRPSYAPAPNARSSVLPPGTTTPTAERLSPTPASFAPTPAPFSATPAPFSSAAPTAFGSDAAGVKASVKGRFVLALSRADYDLAGALSELPVVLQIAWVDQDALEDALAWANGVSLRNAGAKAAQELLGRLPWSEAPLPRVLARLPTLQRSFFNGSDLEIDKRQIHWQGRALGPCLIEVVAGFYEAALGAAGIDAELVRTPTGHTVMLRT